MKNTNTMKKSLLIICIALTSALSSFGQKKMAIKRTLSVQVPGERIVINGGSGSSVGSGKSVVTTVAGLRALATIGTDVVYETTDFGGGYWNYDASDNTSVDNTGTVIVNGTKRLKRITSGATDIRWFGAVSGDNIDDREAIKATINASSHIYFPVGVWDISDSISVKKVIKINGAGTYYGAPSSKVQVASGKHGFVFEAYNTPVSLPPRSVVTGSSAGSEISGLWLFQKTPVVRGHGIWSHVRLSIHDMIIEGFGGDGIHAEATAISSGAYKTVQRIDMNTYYSSTRFDGVPTVAISGDGTGATAHAVMGGSCLTSIVTNGGIYNEQPTVKVQPTSTDVDAIGAGTQWTAQMGLGTTQVRTAGSGYTSATVSWTGGGGSGATGTVQITGGAITGVTVTSPGTGYTTRPATVITGDGTGAVISTFLAVIDLVRVRGGIGYETPPPVYFVGGTIGNSIASGGAAAILELGDMKVKRVVVDNSGSNYTYADVSFSGGSPVSQTGSAYKGTVPIATAVTGGDITGNGNNYKIRDCRITDCFDGINVRGGDFNNGYIQGVDCSTNRRNGFYSNAFLGEKYINCHTAGNRSRAYVTASDNAFTDYDGCYSESDQYPSYGFAATIFTGGDHGAGIEDRNGVWIRGRIEKQATYYRAGLADVINMDLNGDPDNGELMKFWNEAITESNAVRWKIQTGTQDMSWDAANTTNQRYFVMTGKNTGNVFGRTVSQPYTTYIDRLFLGQGTPNTGRNVTSSTFPPQLKTPQTGWGIGDFVFNQTPTVASGVMGWSRLTQGSGNVLGTDWMEISSGSYMTTFKTTTTPATPAAGTVVEWWDGTNKKYKKSDGTTGIIY